MSAQEVFPIEPWPTRPDRRGGQSWEEVSKAVDRLQASMERTWSNWERHSGTNRDPRGKPILVCGGMLVSRNIWTRALWGGLIGTIVKDASCWLTKSAGWIRVNCWPPWRDCSHRRRLYHQQRHDPGVRDRPPPGSDPGHNLRRHNPRIPFRHNMSPALSTGCSCG